MAPVRAVVLLPLLALQSAVAGDVADPLGPAVEGTVARALIKWQPTLLSEISRLLNLLPSCDTNPSPLPADQAPHQKPNVTACAKTCRQLRDQGGPPRDDGVYWLAGLPVPVFCDFSHDGGGWTLLLTAATRDGWDPLSALGRNEHSPSLTDNYSILQHGDAIRDLGNGNKFAYRIEAQAEKGRELWGGVWLAPRDYSFVAQSLAQTDVSVVRKFNNWDYAITGIEKRMPWLHTGNGPAVLTTSTSPYYNWWGTLVTLQTNTDFAHSPWIHGKAEQSGTVLYWVRE